jgi:hypothetical protein
VLKKKKRPENGTLCDPDWIQTNDPKLRRFVLYSAELPGPFKKNERQRYHFTGERKKESRYFSLLVKQTVSWYTVIFFSLRPKQNINGCKD